MACQANYPWVKVYDNGQLTIDICVISNDAFSYARVSTQMFADYSACLPRTKLRIALCISLQYDDGTMHNTMVLIARPVVVCPMDH